MKNNKKTIKSDWFPIFSFFIGTLFLPGFIATAFIAFTKGNDADIKYYGELIAIILETILAIVFIIKYRNKLKEDIKKFKPKDFLKIFLIGIAVVGVFEIIEEILEALGATFGNQESLEELFGKAKILMLANVILVAPIVEEFLFRYSLSTIIKNDKIFLIVSSILFGVMHGLDTSTIAYVLAGLALGTIYLKYKKNLVPSIIVHFMNNLVAAIFMVIGI